MSHAQSDTSRRSAFPDTAATPPSVSASAGEVPAPANDRAQRFARDLDALTVADPAAKRSQLWIRLGVAAMAAGIAVPIILNFLSHNTSDPLVQRDAVILALTGVAIAIVGSVVFLRFSLTNFLRFWLARQAFDMGALAERVTGGGRDVEQTAERRGISTDLPVR